MAFQDELISDINAVFVQEFATKHAINDVDVDCVVEDTDDVMNMDAIGTHIRTQTIYVKTDLLSGRPAPDGIMFVDGRRWTVASVVEEFGLYTIKLEAVRT